MTSTGQGELSSAGRVFRGSVERREIRPVQAASFAPRVIGKRRGMRIDGTSDELRVPSALRDRVSTILAITDPFCTEQLDAEYASLCRRLVAKLARKRPSPLERGDLRIWAAGAIYALGVNNFLFEPARPHT